MVEEDPIVATPERAANVRHLSASRVARVAAAILAALVALMALLLLWLNTQSGRDFAARQVSNLSFANGMTLHVGQIDGSLFGAMEIHDFAVGDPVGVFLRAPLVSLDVRPLAYWHRHIDIRDLQVPEARLSRKPALRPSPPSDQPLLPDIDLDLARLNIDRLDIDPAVTGKRHAVRIEAAVHIADRRARIMGDAAALVLPGMAGGDRVQFILDGAPDQNRLDMDLSLNAPADGLIAALDGRAVARSLRLAGKGSWQAWNGHVLGTMGATTLADVAITGRNGDFGVHGVLRPALLMRGDGAALFAPAIRLDATAGFAQRVLRVDGGMQNANFMATAHGTADFAHNAMQDLRLTLRVMRPTAIATNLSGDDVAGQIVLNGGFAEPVITYGLTARELGFGATRMQGLAMSGSAALDKDHWQIPIAGQVAAITGVSASIAPLLNHVSLDGTLSYANGRLLSDNMRILSSGINATAVVIADIPKALYTGTLNGRIHGYRMDGVGVFDVQSQFGLNTSTAHYFRLGGHVTARSSQWLNEGLRGFLGGNAQIDADLAYDSNGAASLDRLTVAAPRFRLVGGKGHYDADGRIAFAANAQSDAYGPIAVTAGGTVAHPVAHVVADHPGAGVGLAHLVADVRSEGGAYGVLAKADSDYGPIAANLAVHAGTGPLAVDLRPGTSFAAIALGGRVTRLASGPFAGTIAAHGAGVSGHIDLSASGAYQHAKVAMAAQNASLPGRMGVTIGRALINADAVLYDTPQIDADIQLASTRTGDLYLAVARAHVAYRGGAGQVKAVAEGRSRYPFHVAVNGALTPQLWRFGVDGRVNGVVIAAHDPLRIVPAHGEYTLLPASLSVNSGTLRLEGRYGAQSVLHSRLDGVDLALVNAFVPDLGVGGKASGSLDVEQAAPEAFPAADARLQIAGFTRTGLAAVSAPVDISLGGQLSGGGGHGQAILRRGTTVIGQAQLNLAPARGAGNWSTRLTAAPLSGGVRYNGPADVLTSLAALADQSVKGPIGLAADLSGTMQDPRIVGVVRGAQLTYENSSFGTKLTDMTVAGHFANDRLQVDTLTAKARDGTISAHGFVSLSAAQGYPIQLGIDMRNAQLANGQDLSARASGQITLVNGPGQPATIGGTLSLPETHYRIVREGSANVPTLSGVRRKPAIGPERITGAAEAITALPSNWRFAMHVTADNKIFVTGMGLDSEWGADMNLAGTTAAPAITGSIKLVRGTLDFAGHSFDLDTGLITFNGGDLTDPAINITASGTVSDVTINIAITGTGSNPQINLTSSPSLPQDELMARILFGGPVGSLTTIQAVQLASSLNTLRGGKGGLNPLGVLQSATGISRLRVLGADPTTGRETALAAGKYITNNVYVEVVTDTRGYTATQLEVSLTKALSVLSQAGQFGGTGATARYRKRY